jgi:serine/threonine-protein kinase
VSATVTDPLVGRLVDGRYEVRARIARGGMATVYLAVDRRLDRDVALKVMHPHLADGTSGADFVARFRREARTAARLAHPGLVAVFDQGVDGETSYLTMEYVDGENLRRRIGEQGALTLGEALRVTEAVLDALTVAHRAGLVHRDVKPENVLLDGDDRVKLADFGLARAVTEVTSTTTGTVMGTVAYLAPELVVRGEADARTDVYAVGILLYESITGRQPFTGATPIQVAFQHVNTDVPAPSARVPWLPSEVDELVAALTARDPSDRPVDAAAALALARRTRRLLDAPTLARRADVAPTAALHAADDAPDDPPVDDEGPVDEDATPASWLARVVPAVVVAHDEARPPRHRDDEPTTALDVHGGTTVALPIGLGLSAQAEPAAGTTPAEAEPRRRRGLITLLVALVMLLGGGAAWYLLAGPGAFTTVPDGATGVPEQQAVAVLDAHGLTADALAPEFSDTVPSGSVVRTDPAAGERVRKGGQVGYVVSKGVDLVTVPGGLVGAMQADAEAALVAADLTPAYGDEAYDDTAAVGAVLTATLADDSPATEGAQVKRGAVVTLVLSKGPAPVTISSVVGVTVDVATTQLAPDALTVVVGSEEYSDTVPAGAIISQSPVDGTPGHRGDTVTVVVSKGVEMIPLKNYYGVNANTAKAELVSLGFVVDVQYPQGKLLNIVYNQSPDGGDGKTAPKGSTVILYAV